MDQGNRAWFIGAYGPRPNLRDSDRLFWVVLSRCWSKWTSVVHIVQLAHKVCLANPLWGAPRIHGEILKPGIDIAEATVSKYMIRHRGPPSQNWRTFLQNHSNDLISLDFLTVPTAGWTAQQLTEACGMDERPKYLLRDRDAICGKIFSRRARALGIEEVLTAYRSP